MKSLLHNPLQGKRPLILLAVLGICLQTIVLFAVLKDPRDLFWPDPKHYYSIASALVEGQPYSTINEDRNLYRSPGFPWVLSGVIRLVGTDILAIRLTFVACTPLLIWCAFGLAMQIFNRRPLALLAALMTALYPLYLYIPLTLYPETVLIVLYVLIAYLLALCAKTHSLWLVASTSCLLALAAMTRLTALAWVPVAVFYLWLIREHRMSYFVKGSVLLVAIPLLCVTAWMWRNHTVHGAFVFTTAASVNLLNSYNDQADWNRKADFEPDERFKSQMAAAKTLAEKEAVRKARAMEFIHQNPGKALKSAIMQCVDLWNPFPRTATQGGMSKTSFKLAIALSYVPVALLGLAGMLFALRNHFVKALLLLLIANTAMNGIAAVSVRYRVVVDFALILMAAWVLDACISRWFHTGDSAPATERASP